MPALALATPVLAQAPSSVQDYQLPPSPPSPSPKAAGPVDPENPLALPVRPAPSPTAAITLPPVRATTPAVEPTAAPVEPEAPRQRRQPPTVAEPAPPPRAAPRSAATEPPPQAAASQPIPAPAPTPMAVPPPQPATTGGAEEGGFWPWAVGAALLLGLVGFLFGRRRRRDSGAARFEPASSALPTEPEPGPPARLTPTSRLPRRPAPPPPAPAPPAPSPTPAAARLPEPAFPSARHSLDMQLEARHLSRALVNASLAYRLTLTNRGEAPLGPLRIAGDIVSAHASLTREEQLAPGDAALATIHEVPSLAPGESTTLSGELRLPIASIIPIHSGAMRVFVPLARFRADGPVVANTRVFVIGQASDRPGGGLRPFALDRGPGVERGLGQRELAVSA